MYFIKVKFDRRPRSLQDRMHRMMEEMLRVTRPIFSPTGSGWTPEADMYETEESIVLIVNVAGVRHEDIEVSYYDGYLSIAGKRTMRFPGGTPIRHHQLEIGTGAFERVFRIPTLVDPEAIEAKLQDGLLSVQMKKKTRVSRDVIIEIDTDGGITI
ncbi:MAG: hypothetical protein DRH12_07070 [Deltaproteobacteria bacterium]|nr:MAG: hypothetical protein DRH12_07070 [Deltaproteobacteria bacterium]RLB77386.1 MAG: hypothetical protein DRH15_11370 [Deltaproteobacteria bacterium]